MTEFELLTLLVSVVAVVSSTVSLVRGRKLGQMQEELTRISAELAKRQIESHDQAVLERKLPQLGIHISKLGEASHFVITNVGQGGALGLNLELIDCDDNPLVTVAELLPCPELKPRSTLKLLAVFHIGSPMRYQARLTWRVGTGEADSETFWVSRG